MQKWIDSQDQKLSRREMLEQWKRKREKQEAPQKSLSMIPKPPKFEEVLRDYEPKLMQRELSASVKFSRAKDIVPPLTPNVKRNNLNTSMVVSSKIGTGRGKTLTTPISKSQSCKKFPVQQSPRTKPTQSSWKENVLKNITIPNEIYSQKSINNNRKLEKNMPVELMRKTSFKNISPMKEIIDNISFVKHREMTNDQLEPLTNEKIQIAERVEGNQEILSDAAKEETKSNHTNETQCEQASPTILVTQLLDGPDLCEKADLEPQDTRENMQYIEQISPALSKPQEGEPEEISLPKETEAPDTQSISYENEVSQTKKKGSKKRKNPEIQDKKEEDCLENQRGSLKKILREQKLDEATSQKLAEKVTIEFESTMTKSAVKKRATAAVQPEELKDDMYGLEMTLQEIEIKKGKNVVEKMLTSVRRSKRLNSVAKLTSKTWIK